MVVSEIFLWFDMWETSFYIIGIAGLLFLITICIVCRSRPDLRETYTGKIFIVTGAARGVGKELAVSLAGYGARLVVCDVLDLASTVTECKANANVTDDSTIIVPVQCDVSVESDCERVVSMCLESFKQLDVLVLNAGVTQFELFNNMADPVSTARIFMDINFMQSVYFVKHSLAHLRQSKDGAIVCITSGAGVIPSPCVTMYSASKHACHGFFESLRIELEMEADYKARNGMPPDGRVPTIMMVPLPLVSTDDAKSKMGGTMKYVDVQVAVESVLRSLARHRMFAWIDSALKMGVMIYGCCPGVFATCTKKETRCAVETRLNAR